MNVTKRAATLFSLAAAAALLRGQTVDQLAANTSRLQIQVALDRPAYFPGEAAIVTVTVTNPTSGPLQVMVPFSATTGCMEIATQAPDGSLSPVGADRCPPFAGSSYPVTVMAAGEQRQLALSSYANRFDLGVESIPLPLVSGSYVVTYGYGTSATAPFAVVVPHLEAQASAQVQDESSTDPATGATLTGPSYIHAFALRYNNQSYLCVSVSPDGSSGAVNADPSGNFLGSNGLWLKRIGVSANPVVAISETADSSGNITLQWQDSTGAQSTFTYTLQYQLLVDSVPDGAGQVARTSDYSSPNSTVNLTAIPNPGYSFVNWTGAAVADATAASTTITMNNEFNLTANFALTTPMPPPSNISAQVQTATSNPSFANQHLVESVTITNTGGQYISGSLSVVLTNLTNGFTLANATGVFNGSPYIRVYDFGVLNPGQSYVVYLEFNVGPAAIVRYTPSVYSGL